MLQQRHELRELQNGVLDSLNKAFPKVVQDCEQALLELALEVARKVVVNCPVSKESIESNLREAIEQVEDTTRYTVQIHPLDLDILQKHESDWMQTECRRVCFEPSERVGRGGCIVQTKFGTIDATRETRFKLLEKAILQ